ncbi:ATP-binding cassette domain-containing protein [Paenibacillus sp. TRM 82003]|nr:ATP-binding cassette domain-containing protein [Paenibacillus sp. TRM 82003]
MDICIRFENVSYRYARSRIPALQGVDLSIEGGRFIAVLGAPGSGKSTLMQHCNGILLPTAGALHVFDTVIAAGEKLKRANALRRRVGLVFQFPERQLFEATVEADLKFGPKAFGASEAEAAAAALAACELVGLDAALLAESPFALSGGQRRKAAIAAVLASDPDVLALDEPTASLDPASRDELLRALRRLCDERGKTILLVTHRLDETLPYADEYVLMDGGRIRFRGDASSLLRDERLLAEAGVAAPPAARLRRRLEAAFGPSLTAPDGAPLEASMSIPSDTPSATLSGIPLGTPSDTPSATLSDTPSVTPSATLSDTPSVTPSAKPSDSLSDAPFDRLFNAPSAASSGHPPGVSAPKTHLPGSAYDVESMADAIVLALATRRRSMPANREEATTCAKR